MRLRRSSPRRVVWTVLKGWLVAVAGIIAALTVTTKVRKLNRAHRGDGFPRTTADRGAGRRGDDRHDLHARRPTSTTTCWTAIAGAQERILFESFIIKGDAIGQRFKRALIRAAERGVEVRVVYDGFANLVVRPSFLRFPPPVQVLRYPLLSGWMVFNPRRWGRDHRKILVVDDTAAFVGGYNIGTEYATTWRDTHLKVEGDAVWDLDNAFVDFWNLNARGLPMLKDRGSPSWDPHVRAHRNVPRQLVFPIRNMYLEAIDRAADHIYLTAAYFIPDHDILRRPAGGAEPRRRRADPRAGGEQPRGRRLALARASTASCCGTACGSSATATRWCTPRPPRSTAAGRPSARRTSTGSASPATTRSTSRSSTTASLAHLETVFANDLGQATELTLAEWERRARRRPRVRAAARPAAPVALTAGSFMRGLSSSDENALIEVSRPFHGAPGGWGHQPPRRSTDHERNDQDRHRRSRGHGGHSAPSPSSPPASRIGQ